MSDNVVIPPRGNSEYPFIAADPVVYEGQFIRHDYRFEHYKFAVALAKEIPEMVVECDTPEARYPITLTVTYKGRVQVTIRDQGLRIYLSAWIPGCDSLPIAQRSNFESMTVDGKRPIASIARDFVRKVLCRAESEIKRLDDAMRAQGEAKTRFAEMVAQYRSEFPGVRFSPQADDMSVKLFNNATGYYLYGDMGPDGIASIQRFSVSTKTQTRELFALMSGRETEIEASLCIWEAMLENRDDISRLDALWGEHGTVHIRHIAIALGALACRVWGTMSEDERETIIPYDWEFIPAFVKAVDWDLLIDHGGPRLADSDVSPRAIADAILAKESANG